MPIGAGKSGAYTSTLISSRIHMGVRRDVNSVENLLLEEVGLRGSDRVSLRTSGY
jgi:hypothetical protein